MTILLLQRKADGFVIVFFKSTTKLADVLRLPDPPHPHMHSKDLFRRLNHPENNDKIYMSDEALKMYCISYICRINGKGKGLRKLSDIMKKIGFQTQMEFATTIK